MIHSFKIAPLDRTGRLISNPLMLMLAICSIGLIWLIPFLFSPRGYLISPEGITVHLRTCKKVIPKTQIRFIEKVAYSQPGVGLTWHAGLFGYAGLFALQDGSAANVYATRWDCMVRVNTINGDPYLLSPEEPGRFLEAAKKILEKDI